NPVQHLVGARTIAHLPAADQRILLGRAYFPTLITGAFRAGLHAALDFAIVASVAAAAASWTRGGRYVHTEAPALSGRRRGAPAQDPAAWGARAPDGAAAAAADHPGTGQALSRVPSRDP
ncbi:MAG TPA: hypothetical protein VMF60_02220, partial [Acidimicrobiales bacterium]|nr:hypothetical protein [Acidimicrobiales bacterium]